MKDLLKTEPAQLIGALYAFLLAALGLVGSIVADLPEDADWVQVAMVVVPPLLAFLQGKTTRERVYSPQSFEAATGRKGSLS
jgi:hypothetical protein